MFSRKDFTLKRLDQVCQLTNADFSDLARTLNREETLVAQLTEEQEKGIASSIKLFLVAVCALNHVTPEQIVEIYDISQAECIQLLLKLDRIGFIRLQPNNRIKLLVSRDFAWLPNGPIQRLFKQHAHRDYVRSSFDRPDEYFVAVYRMMFDTSRTHVDGSLKGSKQVILNVHRGDVRTAA